MDESREVGETIGYRLHTPAAAERLAPEELTSRSSVRALIGSMARSAPRSVQPTVRALAVRVGADL